MTRVLRWAGRLGLGVVIAAVALELVLQAASLVVALRSDRGADVVVADRGSRRVVLCVGDSNTYGAGASTPDGSYPSQLAALLQERDPDRWHVVNGGYPGRNSAELLHELPGLLHRHQPDLVCILIGTNNRWSDARMDEPPPPLDDPDLARPSRWRLRWRTGRLWAVLRANLRDPTPEVVAQAETGSDPPSPEDPWESSDAPANENPPDRSAHPGKPSRTGKTAAERAATERDPALRHEIREAIDLWGEQQIDAAAARTEALRSRATDSADVRARELYLHLLRTQARNEQALEYGQETVELVGPSPTLCRVLAKCAASLHRHDEARRWIELALEAGPDQAASWSTSAYVARLSGRTEDAIADALQAFALDADEALLRRQQQQIRASREQLETALAAVSLTDDQVHTAREAFRAGAAGLDRALARLEEDLRHMVGHVRAAGATPVLLTYASPVIQETTAGVAFDVAEDFGLPLVDIAAEMRRLLQDHATDEYFVPDRHPNDAGYAVMARMVADTLVELTDP